MGGGGVSRGLGLERRDYLDLDLILAHLNLVTGHLKAEGLIVIGVQGVLLDGRFLLPHLFATLQQVDLDIWIWREEAGVSDPPLLSPGVSDSGDGMRLFFGRGIPCTPQVSSVCAQMESISSHCSLNFPLSLGTLQRRNCQPQPEDSLCPTITSLLPTHLKALQRPSSSGF